MSERRGTLRVDRIRVRELVQRLNQGRLLIPEFQRDYVWKPGRAAKLIDSMFHRLPVGALLVWETRDEVSSRTTSPSTRPSTTSWLIDGQQRSRTLQKVWAADQDVSFEVFFHVIDGRFTRPNAATRRDPRWISVSEVWSDGWRETRSRLREDYPQHADRIEDNVDYCRDILDYEVPVIYMDEHPFEEAVEAFQRLNSLGIRLRKADLESAHVAARHAGFIRDQLVPLLRDLNAEGFGRLNVGHLFRATEALAQPESRRVRLHQLDRRQLDKAWKLMQQGLERTRQTLRAELSVSAMDLLWSGALIVPPLVLHALTRPRERDAQRIAGWVVAAAVFHRYTGATESALDQDLRACLTEDPFQGLLRGLRSSAQRRRLRVDAQDLEATLQDRGTLFGAFVACLHRGALDLFTGQRITTAAPRDRIHRHHVFPRAGFPLESRSDADRVANIAFILPEVNQSIGKTSAEQYLVEIDPKRLSSQCIPTDPALFSDHKRFYKQRADLLAQSLNEFLSDRGIE